MLFNVWSISSICPMLATARTTSLTCLKQWHVKSTSFSARSFSSAPQSATGFRVCVVGSGPAGFYTTDRVMPLHVTQQLQFSIDQLLCSHSAFAAVKSLRTSHQRRSAGNTVISAARRLRLGSSCTAPPQNRVSLQDRLPTPFGLVRSGVAPDHPDTKVLHFLVVIQPSTCF
jgi:hypothetical protein